MGFPLMLELHILATNIGTTLARGCFKDLSTAKLVMYYNHLASGRGEIGKHKGLKSNRSINRVTPTALNTCSNSITSLTYNPSPLFFDGLTVATSAIVVPENDK